MRGAMGVKEKDGAADESSGSASSFVRAVSAITRVSSRRSRNVAGFEVRYLGASVPTDDLLRMIVAEEPDLLVLSATMIFNVPALRTAVMRAREPTNGTLPIAIGGAARVWAKELAAEVGADLTGLDAAELVAAARTRLGVAR